MIKPLLLWTDILLWTVFAIVAIAVLSIRKKPLARETWSQVFRHPVAMVSFLILLFYISIALLDSVHFRRALESLDSTSSAISETHYSPKVESVLEVILASLRDSSEKTYSSPFSAYAWIKEPKELSDGKVIREYPRLAHGGAHLNNPEDELLPDVIMRIIAGLTFSLLLWGTGLCIVLLFTASRTQQTFKNAASLLLRGQTILPWRSASLTILAITSIILILAQLAPYYHVFGTDQVGKDVLFMSLKSIRTGVAIGLITTLVLLPLAVILGISAGFFGGWIDDLIQYVYITLNSIPGVLLIVAAVLMLDVHISNNAAAYNTAASRADLKLLALCCVLGMTSWTSLCRLLRAETLKLRELEYVQAARAFGVETWRILARHVLPNLTHLILITLVIDFSGLVLAEAVLSYIGVGVDPSMESWGNMINSARLELARVPTVWWPLLAAFLLMSALVLAANLFSDAVREALDPRTRERA